MELKGESDMVVLVSEWERSTCVNGHEEKRSARFYINRNMKQLVVVKGGGKRPNLREINSIEEGERKRS